MANYNTYTEEPYVLMNNEGYAATRGDHIQEQTANWEMGAVDPSQQAYSYFQQTGSWPGQEVSVYRQVPQVSQPFPHPHRRVLSDDAVTHFPQADQLPVEQSSMFPYPRTEQGSSSPVASQWTTTAPFPNVDQSAPSPQSSPPSPQSIPSPSASTDSIKDSVKVEPEDAGCFIMEGPPQPTQSALVPPMEVPLRATQAPHEMRHMMNAFRINPFTMHSGEGRGVAQPSTQEPGPLESEPIILEFQLDVPTSESPKEESGSFTLAEDMRRTDWDDDRDDDRSDPDFGQPVSWGNGFSADGDPFAHTQPVVTDFTPRNASRMLATSEPHYYGGRSVYNESNYNINGLTASSNISSSQLQLLRSSPQLGVAASTGSTSWTRSNLVHRGHGHTGGHSLISTTSRSHSLDSSSPGTAINALQTDMLTQGRPVKRWSMQDSTETSGSRFLV